MTRLKHLRSILQGIVLTVVGCNGVEEITPDGNQCFDMFDQQYVLAEPLEPALHLRVESCRMDRAACEELCNYVMQEAGVGYGADTCDVEFEGGETRVDVTWVVQTFADGCSVEGRRPAGLVSPLHGAARDAAGAWLAHAAWLEGASIYAFVHLANELAAFGAPRALVQQSLAAAEDEIRHARTMTQLARRYGATPPRVQIDPVAPRSLAELAVENMLEGCVRETWGAVLALYQAQTARDPVVRAAYAIIAHASDA